MDSTRLELLLEISIEGKCHFVLVDSGASLSVVKPGISNSELLPTQTAAKGITGKKLRITGTQIITFCVGSKVFEHEFLIAPLDVDYSGVLGVNVLKRMQAKVDLRTSTLVLGRTSHRLSGQEVERLTLINCHPQVGREASGTRLITPEATGTDACEGIPIPGLSPGGTDIRDLDVLASGPVVIPPMSEGIVVGKIRGRDSLAISREVLVEPAGIGMPGAYVARVASRVYTREELDGLSARVARDVGRVYTREELDGLSDLGKRSERKSGTSGNESVEACANGVSRVGKGLSLQASKSNTARYCVLKILNTSRRHVGIGKNMKLGTAEAILQCAPRVTGFDSRHLEAGGTSEGCVSSIREDNSTELAEVRAELERRLAHLVAEDRQILMPVVNEYLGLFCNDIEGVLPCTTKGSHKTRTGDALPVKKNPYRVPYALRDEMKKQLDEMMKKGVITPCASPWAAPVILVPKKISGWHTQV